MQHLRIRQHDVCIATDPGSFFGRAVAVVSGGDHPGNLEFAEGPQLIVRERLRREDQQRGALTDRVGCRLGDGCLVAERLARCGTGGDRDVVVTTYEIDRFGLMGPQPLDG